MSAVRVRHLGLAPMPAVWDEMKRFTEARDERTPDELWLVQHPPVFTLGLKGDRSHLLAPGDIPVVHIDRGGHVTYHGPGQAVIYPLIDLRRAGLTIRELVVALEDAVIATVAQYGVQAYGRRDAPGVYVAGRKLAALGLRVRRHCTYHGLAVNVDMDLEPFRGINPCGYAGLEVTQLAQLCAVRDVARFERDFTPQLLARIGA